MSNNLPEEPEGMAHPHDLQTGRPVRISHDLLRELSVLSPRRALSAVAVEWLGIACAVALYQVFPSLWVALALLPFIGARQHALTVIGHDASHYRFLPNRFLNDHVGNFLVQWPVFISVEGFRKYHGLHHRHLGDKADGNRFLWKTHSSEGQIMPEWVYPKTRGQLVLKLIRRALFLTGLRWIIRGVLASFVIRSSWGGVAIRFWYYASFAALFTWQGWWIDFLLLWILPFCTWHIAIQYVRLIAEHSAVASEDAAFTATRTTIPTWLERLFILPRNIGYHIEHHWYPSVPFYNLPSLHAALQEQPRFREHAVISHSVWSSMSRVTEPLETT